LIAVWVSAEYVCFGMFMLSFVIIYRRKLQDYYRIMVY